VGVESGAPAPISFVYGPFLYTITIEEETEQDQIDWMFANNI
jgi:hypothetical protein